VVLIIIALLVMLPRMRAAADRKKAERELLSRRENVATEHRQAASQRETAADAAEQKARLAQQAAERERAEANMEHERASMHERGLADDELIDESERDRFADVAGPDTAAGSERTNTTADADRDGHTVDDRAREVTDHDRQEGSTGATSAEYEQGREDERRFERGGPTDDVSESDRSRKA